jgi:hypothetical protein
MLHLCYEEEEEELGQKTKREDWSVFMHCVSVVRRNPQGGKQGIR